MHKKIFFFYFFRYSPKEPPDLTLPCKHYTKAYRCTSLNKNDIIQFHRVFYKKPDKLYQDNFIIKHTKVTAVHRRRPVNNRGNKKDMAVTYFARRRNSLIPVCKRTFLSILALKKGRVTGVINRHFKTMGESARENRGGDHKTKKYASKRKAITDFINKLVPLEIHYCRSKIKSRQYLSSELNINKLYKMFIAQAADEHKTIKASYFREIFKTKYNIGFGSPRTDMCSTCIVLQERIKYEKSLELKNNLMIESRIHKLRAKAFYNLLKDNSENLLILSFDCEKNQPIPKVPDQSAYYSRQLYVYNLTVVVGNSKSQLTPGNTFIYAWTEDVLPKASNEIASAVFHCLNNVFLTPNLEHITHIRLVADGCSGQNKNLSVLAMAAKWLKDYAPENIKGVEILFPVVGHSFLPSDRIFAKIEKEIKRREVICSPDEYYEIFLNHGTVYYLGLNVKVYNWKEESAKVLKSTTNMHFAFKKSKRFFLKKTRTKENVYVRAQESYNNIQGNYQNICKAKKTVSLINPDETKLYVDIKQNKIDDVKKLLTTHFGENWDEITDLYYYKQVFLRPKSSTAHENMNEECEPPEELPDMYL